MTAPTPSPTPGRVRLLVIDQRAERRAFVRGVLQNAGWQVLEASDAVEALRRAAIERPDVMVAARDLPFVDGCELVRRMRALRETACTPAIGIGSPSDRDSCIDAGFDDFVVEPIDAAVLVEAVRAQLAGAARVEQAPREPSDELRMVRLERDNLQLARQLERAREAIRARGEFMQSLAHELATPLTPVVGYLKLLRSERLGPLTPRQQQVLGAMAHATERLERSIDNLVDYAALETGHYRVVRRPFDATGLVDAIAADFHSRARAKHVRLETRRPPQLELDADERKLRQALTNIVDNAVRLSPHGGHVLVDLTDAGERVLFAVYDQGPGMPIEAQQELQPGVVRRADERSAGTGLGLPVARQIVESHGGALWVESPPKEQPDVHDVFPGTKVAFWIPRNAPAGSA